MTSVQNAFADLWHAHMPLDVLDCITLSPGEETVPSTFRIADAASVSIGAASLAASLILSIRHDLKPLPHVSVNADDAVTSFRSEQLATLDGVTPVAWDELAGIYRAKDGWIRPHTNWKHHKDGALRVLGLPSDATRQELEERVLTCSADGIAEEAMEQGLVVTSLRSFQEWDSHPQGIVAAARASPIQVETINTRSPKGFRPSSIARPLDGVRVLDLSRVIAGPTGGRTLASLGADVLWVNAPQNPSLPNLDFDTSRGKRTMQLDLRHSSSDRETFVSLLRDADVLLQAYRPGGLAELGFSETYILDINPDIVFATLSAYGPDGPWAGRKGFDSLVQVAVGINEAEGRAFVDYAEGHADFKPKTLPCQALDHASGYLLAYGIQVGLVRRAMDGGAFKVTNSLLSTATWLRSLGRNPTSFFQHTLPTRAVLQARDAMETVSRKDGRVIETPAFGARIEGVKVGSSYAPAGLNDDEPRWL